MKIVYLFSEINGITYLDEIIEENGIYRFGVTYDKINNKINNIWVKHTGGILIYKETKNMQELINSIYLAYEDYKIISEEEAFLMLL